MKAKTAPVTGYAVFADGKRVTDVDSPSSEYFVNNLFIQNLKELSHKMNQALTDMIDRSRPR